jgi:hypothetical protein
MQKHWSDISQYVALLIIFLISWCIFFSIAPDYAMPNTTIMRMLFLFVGAQVCGIIISLIGLPDMLGMIFWGVFYTNIGLGNFDELNRLEGSLRYIFIYLFINY